ncbi:MAG TPA: hypothetical protein VHX36_02810 [Candidatus Acidoferrales bacterium]|jgi:hypothetical protein|nr:hypothetical protein [Candidatus Acidoferrales bacterium]
MKINRRKLLSLIGVSPAILAGAPALAEGAPNKKLPVASGPVKIDALNPKGMPPSVQLIPMAPRLDTLDNKTIYLVSDGFAGADRFLNQIAIWFSKNMPSVKTIYRLKAGGLAGDDPALWAEIKKNGNAMIMAYGH